MAIPANRLLIEIHSLAEPPVKLTGQPRKEVRFPPEEPISIVMDGLAQAILSRMREPEDVVFGDQTTAIMWSPDIVSFLRGVGTDRELDIRDAADALNMTLRAWLAGPACNEPHGSV